MVGEVGWKRREYSINRKSRCCGVIWAPSIVRKGGGVIKSIFLVYYVLQTTGKNTKRVCKIR